MGWLQKHNLWLTRFPGRREVYLLISAQRAPFNNLVRLSPTAGDGWGGACACINVPPPPRLLMCLCGAHVCTCSLVTDFNQGFQPCPNISSLLGLLVWRKWVDSGSRAFLEEFKSVWGLRLLHPVQSLQRELYASRWRPGLAMHSRQRYRSDKTRGRHHSCGQRSSK